MSALNQTKNRSRVRAELLNVANRLVLLNRSNRFAKDVARELDALRAQVLNVLEEVAPNDE